jgi:hypothetical protein
MRQALKFIREVDSDDLLVGITSVAAIAIILVTTFISVHHLP